MTADLWPGLLNTTMHRRIGPLSAEAARQLITTPLAPQLTYQEAVIEQMITLTGGHSYVIHMLCSALIRHINEHEHVQIAADAVHRAVEQMIDQASPHFSDLWNRSSRDEQAILWAFAGHGYEADLSLAEAAGLTNLSTNGASNALRNLDRRGLLSSGMDGRYLWRLRLFGDWIKQIAVFPAN
jgi:hypothetical protein